MSLLELSKLYFGHASRSDVAHLAKFHYIAVLIQRCNWKLQTRATELFLVFSYPWLGFPVDEETVFVYLKETARLEIGGILFLKDYAILFRSREKKKKKGGALILVCESFIWFKLASVVNSRASWNKRKRSSVVKTKVMRWKKKRLEEKQLWGLSWETDEKERKKNQ